MTLCSVCGCVRGRDIYCNMGGYMKGGHEGGGYDGSKHEEGKCEAKQVQRVECVGEGGM